VSAPVATAAVLVASRANAGGALRIVNHQLRDSGLDTTRLCGQLRLDWSLSAAVPQAVLDRLSPDLPIRLFAQPLLVPRPGTSFV
jgi:hypothetical protein